MGLMPKNTKKKWDFIQMDAKKQFTANFNLKKGQKVLVLCCGVGNEVFLIREVIGEEGHVTAIDIDEEAIKKALKKNSIKGYNNVDFIVKDASNIEEYQGMFDRVCCLFGINYFVDTESVISNWKKCLKDSQGILGIATWQNSYPNEVIDGFREIANSYFYSTQQLENDNDKTKIKTWDNWREIKEMHLEYSLDFPNAITYWNIIKGNDYYKMLLSAIREEKFKKLEREVGMFIKNINNPPVREDMRIKLIYATQ